MYDLLYIGDYAEKRRLEASLQQRFPDAELEDGSDDIHGARLSVNLPTTDAGDYWDWAVEHDAWEYSFVLAMYVAGNDERAVPILEKIDRSGKLPAEG